MECVLIARSGRRFDLTETGEEVLRIAADIYGDISRLGTVVESRNDDGRLPQPRLEQRVLFRETYAYFCGQRHRLFGQENLTLEQLAAENFVSFTSECCEALIA